jgi:hypothetical protein
VDDDEDEEDAHDMARIYFNSWASSAASDVSSKARTPVPDHGEVFVLYGETIAEGADLLLASVNHLVQIPKPDFLPATMAGFQARYPHDVADYLHVNVKFKL